MARGQRLRAKEEACTDPSRVIPGAQDQIEWGDEGAILAHVGISKVLPLDDHLPLAGRTCCRTGPGRRGPPRPARQVPAGENGVRYAAMLAARGNTPGSAARPRSHRRAGERIREDGKVEDRDGVHQREPGSRADRTSLADQEDLFVSGEPGALVVPG